MSCFECDGHRHADCEDPMTTRRTPETGSDDPTTCCCGFAVNGADPDFAAAEAERAADAAAGYPVSQTLKSAPTRIVP